MESHPNHPTMCEESEIQHISSAHKNMFMKKTLAYRLVMHRYVMAVLLGCIFMLQNASARHKSIVILFENDVHCAVKGYPLMSALSTLTADTAFVGIVSSGDFIQGGMVGSLSKGVDIIDIMRTMHYDAIALGNHEFDYGVPHMLSLSRESGLPFLCLNLSETSTGARPYPAYVIRRYGKKRVAFIGVTTPSVEDSYDYVFLDSLGQRVYSMNRETVYEEVQEVVDSVRRQGADYVVLLSHLGEWQYVGGVDSHTLVARTKGIDCVLDGHTHSVVERCEVTNALGKPVPVVQTGTEFQHIGKLIIDRKGRISVELMPLSVVNQTVEDSGLPADMTANVVDSVMRSLHDYTSTVIATSAYPITINDEHGVRQVRSMETTAGNLVTDAYRSFTGADVAVMNGGGIRKDIAAGSISRSDIVDMLPYDNDLFLLRVLGSDIVHLLSACCANLPAEDGEFPQVSGIRFVVDTQKAERIDSVEIMNNITGRYEQIVPDRYYTMAALEYHVTAGGMYGILKSCERLKRYKTDYREVVVRYLHDVLGGIVPQRYAAPEGRIIIKQ